jgi:hypothetical protein
MADSIPGIKTTLVSNDKVADAGYVTVYDKDEMNVYEAAITQIVAKEDAVMTGWCDWEMGLWRVPLVPPHPYSLPIPVDVSVGT